MNDPRYERPVWPTKTHRDDQGQIIEYGDRWRGAVPDFAYATTSKFPGVVLYAGSSADAYPPVADRLEDRAFALATRYRRRMVSTPQAEAITTEVDPRMIEARNR